MAPRMKSKYPVILIGVVLRKEHMKRGHGDSLQNTTRKEGEHFALGSVLFCNTLTLTLLDPLSQKSVHPHSCVGKIVGATKCSRLGTTT